MHPVLEFRNDKSVAKMVFDAKHVVPVSLNYFRILKQLISSNDEDRCQAVILMIINDPTLRK